MNSRWNATGDRPSSGLPPGLHLHAEVTIGTGGDAERRQLRLLGDDRRGYLLAGLGALPESEGTEFWFATLEEAKQAATAYGVPDDGWSDLASDADVRLQPG